MLPEDPRFHGSFEVISLAVATMFSGRLQKMVPASLPMEIFAVSANCTMPFSFNGYGLRPEFKTACPLPLFPS